MAGHSKWSNIKHKKGAADAKRGKVWSKIIKEITIAAKHGGGDLSSNPRLRTVVDKGKAANMPNDNITRAIKRGTGELEGVNYEETSYEGYGPGGTAVMIEIVTDNKNRTVAEMRHLFSKNNGNLGENGCVAWMFDRQGVITFDAEHTTEDQLMNIALDAGAEDIRSSDGIFEVVSTPDDFDAVHEALTAASLTPTNAEIQMVPQNTVTLEGKDAANMIKLMEALEEHDDVQNVFANFDIDDSLLEELC